MDISNGRLGFTQDLDNQKFLNALRQSNRGVTDFNAHLQQNFNQSLISVNDLAKGVTAFLTIDMARDFVTQMVKIRGEFEQTEIAFNTMLQSREKGNALMQEMVELAKNTPMQFSEVSQGAKQLLAYQVEAEKLTETLSMLGDISSGLSVPMSRLILVYGQVRAKGRLMGDDLRQFTEAGVPMIAMIAKNMGIAQSAVADMVSEGKVGFKEVEKVLEQLTSQGGLFYNMMEEQSKTIPGQIAKLQDEIEQMFNNIGKDSQGFVTSVISGASSVVENYKEIGNVLGVLITTYGAYKAALFAAHTLQTTEASMLKNTVENLRENQSFTARKIVAEYDYANAKLTSAKAEEIASRAVLKASRENLNALQIDKSKAFEKLNAAHSARDAADIEVAAAQKQYDAYKGSHWVKKENEALSNLEAATAKRNALSKDIETASIEYNTVAEKTNTASKTLNGNVQDLQSKKQAVGIATKNLDTAATTRLTFSQRLNIAATELATIANDAFNASLLANPIVLITVGVVGLASAIYFLSDNINGAKDAQDRFNESQQKNSNDLESFTQNLNSYIQTIKDSTKTQSEQIQAYSNLINLRTQSFEGLSIEEVKLMSVADAQSKVNKEIESYKNIQVDKSINDLKNRIDELNESLKEEINLWEQKRLTDEIEKTGQLLEQQLYIQEDINIANKLASMNKQEQVQYLTELIKKHEDNVNLSNRVNDSLAEGTSYLNSANIATNIWTLSLSNTASNIDYITSRMSSWKSMLDGLSKDTSKAIGKSYGERNYDDWKAIQEQAINDQKNLGISKKGTKEWQDLQKVIDGATQALKAWDTTKTKTDKPKSIKLTKKSDDPVEIYKKQVSEIEKQHERYLKILDSNDISFVTEKAILQSQLSSKGKTYEEYLRTQQKELSKTAETSEITRKKLSFVNDELLKLIDHSEVEIFKDNLDKQLDNADSIIEKLKIIDDIRNELSSNTNELTAPKIEFVDKTQLELIDQLDQKSKELVASLGGGYSQLQKLTNEYNNDILILTESLKNAKTEAEKTVINDSIWKRGVKFAEDSKDLPTNDDNYNKLLLEFKSFEQKKSDITLDFDNKISVAKLNNDKKLEEQLLQEKKKALSKIALEQMKSSESFVKLLGNLDKMSVKSLDKLIKDIESQLDNPEIGLEMSAEDIKIILDQLQKAKDEIENKNPFKAIQDGWSDFWNATTDDDKLEALDKFMSGVNSAFEATKEIMDMTTDAVEAFGGKLDDSAKQTIQSVQNIVNGIGNAIQGYFSGDWAKMIAGIVQVVVEVAKIIGGSKDRRLEKRLKKQQQAVNDLKRAYDDLSFAIDRALGGKNYSLQQDQIKNLQEQKILMEQMIKNEEKKKKTDKNKVNEWKNAIADIDRQIQEIQENIASDILQTTAKELANTLGDALAEAFSKGEDAAKSFEKVANDVLKNAVLNQLKKRFIEDQLQKALDQLQKDMGVDDKGWSGLTPEEQQAFRDKIKEIAEGFQGALEGYSELFSDLVDPNESSLAGAIKGVSEETASLIAGQVNAMRLLIVEANKTRIETNRILLQSLDRLANIDFNTKNANVILDKMYAFMQSNKDNNRSYGF